MIEIKHVKYNTQGSYLHLTDDTYILDIDNRTGLIKGLYFQDDPSVTNYMGNELNMKLNVWWKQRYVPEKSQRTPMYCWTGDIVLKAKTVGEKSWRGMYTSVSDDIRSISYDDTSITVAFEGSSENPGGLSGVNIRERFALAGGAVEWTIELENTSGETLLIGELGLPIVLNTNHSIGGEQDGVKHRGVDTLKYVFEHRLAGHSFVSGHSSHIDAERLCGTGDHLLIMPDGDTSLEAMLSDYYQFSFCPVDDTQNEMMIAKGPVFYIYSETAAREPWYNGHTSTSLSPGEKREFRFKMIRASDYRDVSAKLYDNGKVTCKVAPGMVLPVGATGHLLLQSKAPIHSVGGNDGISITETVRLGDRYAYSLTLNSVGEQRLRVEFGEGGWMNLWFYGIEPIEKLIKARARFSATRQQILDPENIRQYGFTYWDNLESRQVRRDESNDAAVGGGNEQSVEAPVFLCEKNFYYPDPVELKALDDFVEKFVLGKLQNTETYEVLNSIFGPREGTWRRWDYVWRYYNYPHFYNLYFNLYRIAKKHKPKVLSRSSEDYLLLAYNTARVSYADSTYESIFETKNYWDYHCGNMSYTHGAMGGWNVYNIIETLKLERMAEEYEKLKATVENSWPFFLTEDYPYATEYCFDSPSFPAVYYTGKAASDPSLMKKTVNVIMASRHKAPQWFTYGVDLKGIGNYTTPLGARPLLDTFERTGNQDLLRYGYAATLGVWTCVDIDGRGYWNREWKFNASKTDRNNAYWNGYYSGEIGSGLQGNLYALKAYLVRDSDFGVIGYGCEVKESDTAYVIEPWDGLGARLSFHPLDIAIDTDNCKIVRATATADKMTLELIMEKPHENAKDAGISVTGMGFGKYAVEIDGKEKTIDAAAILEIGFELAPQQTNVVIKKL